MLITMKKYIPIFAVIFGLTIYLVNEGFLEGGDPTASTPAKQSKVNKHYEEVLKSFSATTFEKEKLSYRNPPKVLIVNFWASWCTPCLEEFPSLNELTEKFKGSDLKIVGVNTDEKDQNNKVKKILSKYDLKFPVVLDKDGSLINDFLVSTIPISIIYHNGKVVEVSKGSKDFMSEEFLEQVKSWLK